MPSERNKYREEQRRYIETKKAALKARQEKWTLPKPEKYVPPPQNDSHTIWWVLGGILTASFLIGLLIAPFQGAVPSTTTNHTLWIQGNRSEFEQLQAWVSDELANHELNWDIAYLESPNQLYQALTSRTGPDLILIEQELAMELYNSRALERLQPKNDLPVFSSFYHPLWEERPWLKQMGWAIPAQGDVDAARHLYTVFQLFSPEFPAPWQ